jgi:hypothetical protein
MTHLEYLSHQFHLHPLRFQQAEILIFLAFEIRDLITVICQLNESVHSLREMSARSNDRDDISPSVVEGCDLKMCTWMLNVFAPTAVVAIQELALLHRFA